MSKIFRILLIFWIMVVNVFWSKTSISLAIGLHRNTTDLNGVFLKFVVYSVPPFYTVTLKSDGNYSVTGSSTLQMEWLSERLNFTHLLNSFVYVVLNQTAISKYGSSNELLIDLVAKKEVDGSAISLIITPERKALLDFTSFVWIEPYSMVVPRPGEDDRLFDFIRVFEPTVWLLILTTIIIMIILMTFLSKLYATNGLNSQQNPSTISRQRRERSIYEYIRVNVSYIANTLTNQGGNDPGVGLSFRLLVGVWVLVATVLVNSYSSLVTSYLTVPRMIPPINNFEDLAASKEVGIVLLADTIIGQHILRSESGALKILGDQARRNPNRLVTSVPKAFELLETKHYALPYLESVSNFFVASHFKTDNKCHYVATDPLPMCGVWFLPLQKNSKFTPMFQTALIEFWETGLPPFQVKSFTPSAPKCFVKIKPETTLANPIKLNDVMGIFLIWGIGITLSIVVFFIEVLFSIKVKNKA